MKMLLLTVSLFILSCNSTGLDFKIDDYKFSSVLYWNEEKFDIGEYDVCKNIKKAKQIDGPIKGIILKYLKLVNEHKQDTLIIVIYGDENLYFKMNNKYFKAKNPVIPLDVFQNEK